MPMPLDSGRDIQLVRTPATGAFDSFNWDNTNNPTFDDSDQHIALSYLLETEYWGNPQRGSKVPLIKNDRTGTDTQLQAAAEDAYTPALNAQQLRSVTISVQKKAPGSYALSVSYQNRSGHQQNLRLPLSV